MKLQALTATLLASGASLASAGDGSFQRFYTLRDNTNFMSSGKPNGGWMITPVHQMVLPSGKVLVAAWARAHQFSCSSGVKYGTTFVIDPETDLTGNGGSAHRTHYITPLDEKPAKFSQSGDKDTITFSGHATLPDSRRFFIGGTRLKGSNWGQGIDYARIYNTETNSYERVSWKVPFGNAWYPTAVALPDQRMLVVQGFHNCCTENASGAIATFDFQRYMNGKSDPWQLMLSNSESDADIRAESSDYSRLYVLPLPVMVDGIYRQVVTMGRTGRMGFLNTDMHLPAGERFADRPNNLRPGSCGQRTTGAILANGELLTMGGCRLQYMDLYDPVADSWRTVNTQIVREYGSSVLLPDGTVLIINGENQGMNQYYGIGSGGDPRTPQIYDPFTNTLRNLAKEPADGTDKGNGAQGAFRGYHNTASLLPSGRILMGGGRHQEGAIGCEHPSIRVFNLPFLSDNLARPTVTEVVSQTLELTLEDPTSELRFKVTSENALMPSSGAVNTRSGVSLIAYGAITHSYDQHQRYVPLGYRYENDEIIVSAPSAPQAIPGDYMLFFVDDQGTPSEAVNVKVLPARGKWLRTVIYVEKVVSQGEFVGISGGHSQVDKYEKSQADVPVVHMSYHDQQFLKWDQGTSLAWTTTKDAYPTMYNNREFYATMGYGVDPENIHGDNHWKFEAYVKVTDDSPTHQDWFEFTVYVQKPDGSKVYETPVTHNTINGGESPPGVVTHHWAKKGAVNRVTFGEGDAEIYSLNETPVPESMLPYTPGTFSPTAAPSTSPTTSPTKNPTVSPTVSPTKAPTISPTMSPSKSPTVSPTLSPTTTPTASPTTTPTASPTVSPTSSSDETSPGNSENSDGETGADGRGSDGKDGDNKMNFVLIGGVGAAVVGLSVAAAMVAMKNNKKKQALQEERSVINSGSFVMSKRVTRAKNPKYLGPEEIQFHQPEISHRPSLDV